MKAKSFALDDDSLTWLRTLAEQQDRSRSQIVRRAIRQVAQEAGIVTEQKRTNDANRPKEGD